MGQSPEDELFGELLSKDPYEEPSPFGEILLKIEASPASMQSRKEAIEALQKAVREHTTKYKFLLTGDVNVEITWHFHERGRYESDASADIDNLLKPMLDAFCGPEGLIVDDCQIRSLDQHNERAADRNRTTTLHRLRVHTEGGDRLRAD